jgi:hypothetical protein
MYVVMKIPHQEDHELCVWVGVYNINNVSILSYKERRKEEGKQTAMMLQHLASG